MILLDTGTYLLLLCIDCEVKSEVLIRICKDPTIHHL